MTIIKKTQLAIFQYKIKSLKKRLKKKRQQISTDEEKRELSRTVGGNVNWYHYGKQDGSSLKH